MRHGIDPWVFFAIPLVVIGLGLLIASSRRGSAAGTRIGSRRLELRTPAEVAMVFDRLRTIGGKYRVDDADVASRVLVLSSPPTIATWGFLYPIHLHEDNGGTRIEIGITSRFIQIGPLVTSAHKQCVQAIEDLLGVPAARIA